MVDINDYASRLGRSKQSIADQMSVELTTVRKQMTVSDGNLTLATVYRYAEALGGAVLFLTDEQYQQYKDSDLYKAGSEELTERVDGLLLELEQLRTQNAQLTESVQRIQKQNDVFADALTRKDEELYQQSQTIRRLLEKYAF